MRIIAGYFSAHPSFLWTRHLVWPCQDADLHPKEGKLPGAVADKGKQELIYFDHSLDFFLFMFAPPGCKPAGQQENEAGR